MLVKQLEILDFGLILQKFEGLVSTPKSDIQNFLSIDIA